jgi:hypothetical protein
LSLGPLIVAISFDHFHLRDLAAFAAAEHTHILPIPLGKFTGYERVVLLEVLLGQLGLQELFVVDVEIFEEEAEGASDPFVLSEG